MVSSDMRLVFLFEGNDWQCYLEIVTGPGKLVPFSIRKTDLSSKDDTASPIPEGRPVKPDLVPPRTLMAVALWLIFCMT